MDDFVKRPEQHSKIWSLFHDRQTLSPEVLEQYAAILDRCQRIEDKNPQIQNEIKANRHIYREEVHGPKREKLTEEQRVALMSEAKIDDWVREFEEFVEQRERKGSGDLMRSGFIESGLLSLQFSNLTSPEVILVFS